MNDKLSQRKADKINQDLLLLGEIGEMRITQEIENEHDEVLTSIAKGLISIGNGSLHQFSPLDESKSNHAVHQDLASISDDDENIFDLTPSVDLDGNCYLSNTETIQMELINYYEGKVSQLEKELKLEKAKNVEEHARLQEFQSDLIQSDKLKCEILKTMLEMHTTNDDKKRRRV